MFIHIDKNSEGIIKAIMCDSRVHVISEYYTKWGSPEIVWATESLFRNVLESNVKFSHIMLGSGQDLLVKKGLNEKLDEDPETIYWDIRHELVPRTRAGAKYGIRWPSSLLVRNNASLKRMIRILLQLMYAAHIPVKENKKTISMPVYSGSTWFIIPYHVGEFFVDYIKMHPEYKEFFKESIALDIMYFQTLVMNSEFKANIKPGLMYIKRVFDGKLTMKLKQWIKTAAGEVSFSLFIDSVRGSDIHSLQ